MKTKAGRLPLHPLVLFLWRIFNLFLEHCEAEALQDRDTLLEKFN